MNYLDIISNGVNLSVPFGNEIKMSRPASLAPFDPSSTADFQEMDNRFLHPWEDFAAYSTNRRMIAERGEGIHVIDSDGNRLIDGPAGQWCVNLGYGRREIAEAMAEQALRLPYFAPWSHGADISSRLAARLAQLTPGDLHHISFTTSGSTAVDSALRLVFFRNNVRGLPGKKIVLSRQGAYHGSTFLAATCSGKMHEKANMDMAEGLVRHLSQPKPSLRRPDQSVADFCREKIDEFERTVLEIGPERVAAFIAEPVQGAGGVIVPPPGYFPGIKKLCEKHDVIFIADEIVTAFGRLGHWFAMSDVFGVVPDMITMAKGLTSAYAPMGALAVSDRLIRQIQDSNSASKTFFNGYTYAGHPVSAAAALKTIEIMEREQTLAHVREVAPYFQARMAELGDLSSVREVRGLGLMAGVECALDPAHPDLERDSRFSLSIDEHCRRRGLLLRPIYSNAVLSPPLTVTRSDIDAMVGILRQAIEAAADETRSS